MELWKPEKVRRRGNIRFFKTPLGSHVIVLPTCSVPLEHLVVENWLSDYKGNVREVRAIMYLRNSQLIVDREGKKVMLYAKSPERKFSVSTPPWLLVEGEKKVKIQPGDVRVEKQATWEARILLGLAQKGIKAEEPQAIVIHRDGSREVITKGIPGEKSWGFKGRNLRKRAANAGFVPVDLNWGNIIKDPDGNDHIIDVNRWEWPPVTDVYKKRLIQTVREEIEKKKKAKK